MKIIHFTLGKANPERMNGVTRVVYQLARVQQELGKKVAFWGVTPNPVHDYPERSFETLLFKKQTNPFDLDKQIRKTLEQDQKVVFHLHGAFVPEIYSMSRLLQKMGIPYVHSSHGGYSPVALQKNAFQKKIYFRLFEQHLLKGAQTVHLLGQTTFNHVQKLIDLPQRKLIPNGMDFSEIPTLDVNKYPEFSIGFCGRLYEKVKGLDLLLMAFNQFLERGGKGKLHLIGDGRDRATLEQTVVDLGIQDEVIFHGAQYGDDKYEYLLKTHLFVHTSRTEGFPMGVVEAASIGLPCLVTQATNAGPYIQKHQAGFVVPNEDIDSISNAIWHAYTLYKTHTLEQLGANSAQMAQVEFDWKVIAEQFETAYRGQQGVIATPE